MTPHEYYHHTDKSHTLAFSVALQVLSMNSLSQFSLPSETNLRKLNSLIERHLTPRQKNYQPARHSKPIAMDSTGKKGYIPLLKVRDTLRAQLYLLPEDDRLMAMRKILEINHSINERIA